VDYKSYHPENLEKAIVAVQTRQMTQYKAARFYGVPQTTISTRLLKFKNNESGDG
jgi:hypothetical protein